MTEENKKVIVGMSGGVDSSVTAALLKKNGYAVTGVFLLTRNNAEEDQADAKKVCVKLNVPLRVVDVKKRFEKEVIGYFLKEYEKGRTPNPCVFCNENLKFKILFEEMDKLGMDYAATGHYARIKIKNQKSKCKMTMQNLKCVSRLFRAKDENKDQSYFLYRLGQKQLSRIIFPLGEYKKEEVRKLAKKFKLPVSEKKESQDVCFLAGGFMENFLKKNLKLKKGKIVNAQGEIIGRHEGLPLYTLGQRKGIAIGGTGPYYVSGKNWAKNRLIVTNDKKETLLFSASAILEKVNWIKGEPDLPARFLVRARYRNPLVYATIKSRNTKHEIRNKECEVIFDEPQRAVTPGQSVVFYAEKGEVVGGGIIF